MLSASLEPIYRGPCSPPASYSQSNLGVRRRGLTLFHLRPTCFDSHGLIQTRSLQFVAAGMLILAPCTVHAQDKNGATTPTRPSIQFNRWQEDWSVLADPRVPREPFDNLKYIPLSPNDPKSYLSFGADVRERFEANNAASFGVSPNRNADYLLSRSEMHADLRWGSEVQVFTQFQSDFAPWKTMLTPVDQNRLDLEQAFVALTESLNGGTLKVRLGRQQYAFDLQRFVSVRDGPNVRQSFDAAWVDYENDPWRFISFYSHPVQVQDKRAFDDFSSNALTFGGVRAERKLSDSVSLAAYYARFTQDGVSYLTVSGDERRDIIDVHFSGKGSGFDWDLEGMAQSGRIADKDIKAWAVGALAGYTFSDVGWMPRLGIQFDAASGDKNPLDNQLGTFNPLFPNGYYFTLAGYTGYVNIIHFKQSATVQPTKELKLMFAVAEQWRTTTADAVYFQPNIPVRGTAGQPGRYTGTYEQFRADWALTTYSSFAVEAVHFAVGDAIRRAGGHDSTYLGVQIAYGW